MHQTQAVLLPLMFQMIEHKELPPVFLLIRLKFLSIQFFYKLQNKLVVDIRVILLVMRVDDNLHNKSAIHRKRHVVRSPLHWKPIVA